MAGLQDKRYHRAIAAPDLPEVPFWKVESSIGPLLARVSTYGSPVISSTDQPNNLTYTVGDGKFTKRATPRTIAGCLHNRVGEAALTLAASGVQVTACWNVGSEIRLGWWRLGQSGADVHRPLASEWFGARVDRIP